MFTDWFSRRSAAVSIEPVAPQWTPTAAIASANTRPSRLQLAPDLRASAKPMAPIKKAPEPSQEPLLSHQRPMAFRRQRPDIAAKKFVQWLIQQNILGEYRWIDLWAMYRQDYCRQASETPVAPNYQAQFAQQLGHLCRRDYYREIVNGRRRFYRTYHIQPIAGEMANAEAA